MEPSLLAGQQRKKNPQKGSPQALHWSKCHEKNATGHFHPQNYPLSFAWSRTVVLYLFEKLFSAQKLGAIKSVFKLFGRKSG